MSDFVQLLETIPGTVLYKFTEDLLRPSRSRMVAVASGKAAWTAQELKWLNEHPEAKEAFESLQKTLRPTSSTTSPENYSRHKKEKRPRQLVAFAN